MEDGTPWGYRGPQSWENMKVNQPSKAPEQKAEEDLNPPRGRPTFF